jgi:Fe-S-cluster-containing hydrogenase component 2
MKIITVNPNKCTACRLCELACSLKNAGEFNPTRARIQVMGFEDMFSLPMMCFQCEKPYCAEICPTGAITITTGILKVSKNKCIGCKACAMACPFGNITFSDVERVAIKCELCDGEPECVLFCPTGALEYKDAEDAMTYKKTDLYEKLKGIYQGIQSKIGEGEGEFSISEDSPFANLDL